MLDVEAVKRLAPVIAVLVIDRLESATALVAGGLTPLGGDAAHVRRAGGNPLMAAVEGATIGASTVLDAHSLDAAFAAGARFNVSPGLSEPVARAATAT